jgi:hypothetical protein
VSDRRAKLVAKLNHQKAILAPDYQKPITKRGNRKIVQPNGSVAFLCRWGHGQLEIAPGMKGITATLNDLPGVIDPLPYRDQRRCF